MALLPKTPFLYTDEDRRKNTCKKVFFLSGKLPTLHNQFFFPVFFQQDRDCLEIFTSKKGGRKRPPHAVMVCRLVVLLSCNNWAFTPSLARAYFCPIARSNDIENFFLVVIARTRGTSIAIRELSIARSDDDEDCIFHVVL